MLEEGGGRLLEGCVERAVLLVAVEGGGAVLP